MFEGTPFIEKFDNSHDARHIVAVRPGTAGWCRYLRFVEDEAYQRVFVTIFLACFGWMAGATRGRWWYATYMDSLNHDTVAKGSLGATQPRFQQKYVVDEPGYPNRLGPAHGHAIRRYSTPLQGRCASRSRH